MQPLKNKPETSSKKIDAQTNPESMQKNPSGEYPTPSKSLLNGPLPSTTADPYGPISGQLMGTMKEACKETFLGGNPRIVQGMYKCTIYSPMEYYGNVCDVIKRRRGNIVDNDYQDLTSLYIIIA
jgi:translation elongation factor EF-G